MALESRTPFLRLFFLSLILALSTGMLPLYPRPALYDMQLTSSIRVSVEFRGIVQDVHATFTFHPHSQCVKGESYNYSVLLWQDDSTQPFYMEGPFLVSSCRNMLDVTVDGLHKAQHYTAAVVAYNDRISVRSKRVDVYTSAVQAVEVVEGEECMFVTCYFAPGSTAQGCQVQLKIVATHSSQHLHSWQFNISQDPDLFMGTLHIPLEPRTTALDVTVYDLSPSGRVGDLSIPPHVTHSTGLNCDLGETLTPLRAKAKMVLFYVSASFFILGIIIICGGMLCKIGRLHRHFRNKSYEILEGRRPSQHHISSTLSEDERPSKNTRHLAHPPPPKSRPQPLDSVPSNSYKPRAKTYGSYDALGSPTARLLNQQGMEQGGGGGGGETRWGGSLREPALRDGVIVSLHSQPEAMRVGTTEDPAGHTTAGEGGMNPVASE